MESDLTILIRNGGVRHYALAKMIRLRVGEEHILTTVELLLNIWDREILDYCPVSKWSNPWPKAWCVG